MHFEFLQGSFLSVTNVYLGYTGYFGGHLGFGIKMTPKHNFKTRTTERILRPKISGIRGITQVYAENDRQSSVLDLRHLQATFLKKNQLSKKNFHFKV